MGRRAGRPTPRWLPCLCPSAALGHRQIEHVIEVGREPDEVTGGQVDRRHRTPAFPRPPRPPMGESGDTPHLVIDRQGPGDWRGILTARTGDQDLVVRAALMVGDVLSGDRRCGVKSTDHGRCDQLRRRERAQIRLSRGGLGTTGAAAAWLPGHGIHLGRASPAHRRQRVSGGQSVYARRTLPAAIPDRDTDQE